MATLFKSLKDTLNRQKEQNGQAFQQSVLPPVVSPVMPITGAKTQDTEVDAQSDMSGKIGTITPPVATPVAPVAAAPKPTRPVITNPLASKMPANPKMTIPQPKGSGGWKNLISFLNKPKGGK